MSLWLEMFSELFIMPWMNKSGEKRKRWFSGQTKPVCGKVFLRTRMSVKKVSFGYVVDSRLHFNKVKMLNMIFFQPGDVEYIKILLGNYIFIIIDLPTFLCARSMYIFFCFPRIRNLLFILWCLPSSLRDTLLRLSGVKNKK